MPKERQHRRAWTQQEDQVLRTAVDSLTNSGEKPEWKKIADYLAQNIQSQFPRNAKQCRERWYNALDPAVKQPQPWGIQQDVKLIQACKEHGHRWSKLVAEFDGRITDNRLKNHFYSNVRKIIRYLNHFIKEQKRKYQEREKNNDVIDENQKRIMKQISKLRNIDIKLLSKVFSLVDSKQQYKYQAKRTISKQEISSLNLQILNFIESYITQQNKFTSQQTLELLVQIMRINGSIKAKYTRQSKMSLQKQEQIVKNTQIKKKIEKKLNKIIKQEVQNKIIPNKQQRVKILQKINKTQNDRITKMMSRISQKKSIKQQDFSMYQQNNELEQRMNIEIEPSRNQNGKQCQASKKKSKSYEHSLMYDFKTYKNQQLLKSSFQYYNKDQAFIDNNNQAKNFGSLILGRSGGIQQSPIINQQIFDNLDNENNNNKGVFGSEIAFQSNFLKQNVKNVNTKIITNNNANSSVNRREIDFIKIQQQQQEQKSATNKNNIFNFPLIGANHSAVDGKNKLTQSQGFFEFPLFINHEQKKNNNTANERLFRSSSILSNSLCMENSLANARDKSDRQSQNSNFNFNMDSNFPLFDKNSSASNNIKFPARKQSDQISQRQEQRGLFTHNNGNHMNQRQNPIANANMIFSTNNPFGTEHVMIGCDFFQENMYSFSGIPQHFNSIEISREISLQSQLYHKNGYNCMNAGNINIGNNMLIESQNRSFDFYKSLDYQFNNDNRRENLAQSYSFGQKSQESFKKSKNSK